MAKVNRRGGFSDRNGIKTINTEIQLKNFDERTRTRIRNNKARYFKKYWARSP